MKKLGIREIKTKVIQIVMGRLRIQTQFDLPPKTILLSTALSHLPTHQLLSEEGLHGVHGKVSSAVSLSQWAYKYNFPYENKIGQNFFQKKERTSGLQVNFYWLLGC
jgi:hypothetical protein